MAASVRTTARHRAEYVAKQTGNDDTRFMSRRAPIVTYSKLNRPLNLRGSHLKRPSPYDIPPDGDDELPISEQKNLASRKQPAPDDPPLSESELDAVYGSYVSPIRSTCTAPSPLRPIDLAVTKPRQRTKLAPAATPVVPTRRRRSNTRNRTNPATRLIAHCQFVPKRTDQHELQHDTPAQPSAKDDCTRSRCPKPTPGPVKKEQVGRLAVNELFLVRTPPKAVPHGHPTKSKCQTPEPTDVICSSHGSLASSSDAKCLAKRAPLSAFRQRLRTFIGAQKRRIGRPRKSRRQTSATPVAHLLRTVGDGFSSSEMVIRHRVRPRDNRKPARLLSPHFRALQLKAGPLPDVKFEPDIGSVQLELDVRGAEHILRSPDVHIACGAQDDAPSKRSPHVENYEDDPNDIAFSDSVRYQLSSITAPRRIISISSSGSEGEDFEVTGDETEGESSEEEFATNDPSQGENSSPRPVPEPPRPAHSPRNEHGRTDITMPPDDNQYLNYNIKKDYHGAARSSHHIPRAFFSSERSAELNDMLQVYAEPSNAVYIKPSTACTSESKYLTDNRHRHRPRSILRNLAPDVQETGTRQEDTAANTRRNSAVNPEGSRYFTNAVDRPQAHLGSSTGTTQHWTSEQQANRHAPKGIHVPNSDSMVCETSPERLGNNVARKMSVLKTNADTMWLYHESLSQKAPDLRTLTRRVSTRNGTLSQSVRRKASLHFQPPAIVKMT